MNPTTQWIEPAGPPELARDEVHVWRVVLTAPGGRVERLEGSLSADERDRAARFRFDRDRQAFIVARGALRQLLGAYLSLPPDTVRFQYNERGKPDCLVPAGSPPLCFNVSHSGELALLALAPGRAVGVDVERRRALRDLRQIARRFFSEREVQALLSLSSQQHEEAFYHCWTRKEAYIKGRGLGLAYPLRGFDVTLAPGEPARLLDDRTDPAAAERWRLEDLTPGPGYAAALAVEHVGGPIRCWQWTPQ